MEKWQKLYFTNGIVNAITSAIVFLFCLVFLIMLNVEIANIRASGGPEGLALIVLIPLAFILCIVGIVFLLIGIYAVLLLIQLKKGVASAYKYRKMLIVFAVFAFIFALVCVIGAIVDFDLWFALIIAAVSIANGVYNIICNKEIKNSFIKSVDNNSDMV